MLDVFKGDLRKRGDKNFTFVNVRSSHSCSHCCRTIGVGSECLTINPKKGSRQWFCCDCVQLVLNVMQAQANLQSVAFGDEGAFLACMEAESDALSELEQARGGRLRRDLLFMWLSCYNYIV